MITAEIVAKSRPRLATAGGIVTFKLVYPSFIHQQLLTHGVFVRNTSSSRAIPAAKFARLVRENPAMPVFFGAAQSGMRAEKEVANPDLARQWWLEACDAALEKHAEGMRLGLHKEVLNRILQPFQHSVVLVSTTDLGNWRRQRLPEHAQEEIRTLARAMDTAFYAAPYADTPWHLPLVGQYPGDYERRTDPFMAQALVSASRCARISFLLENKSYEADLEDGKVRKSDGHWSPFGHQAYYSAGASSRQFRNWVQHRALVDGGIGELHILEGM